MTISNDRVNILFSKSKAIMSNHANFDHITLCDIRNLEVVEVSGMAAMSAIYNRIGISKKLCDFYSDEAIVCMFVHELGHFITLKNKKFSIKEFILRKKQGLDPFECIFDTEFIFGIKSFGLNIYKDKLFTPDYYEWRRIFSEYDSEGYAKYIQQSNEQHNLSEFTILMEDSADSIMCYFLYPDKLKTYTDLYTYIHSFLESKRNEK